MQNREGGKGPYVIKGFVSAPAQVRVGGGIKTALSSLLVTVAGPDHTGTLPVQSLMHFNTLQTNPQAHLKDMFWCSSVT